MIKAGRKSIHSLTHKDMVPRPPCQPPCFPEL